MNKSPKIFDISAAGMIFRIARTAEETNGASFEMEWELLPKASGTPVHIHPEARESYKVTEGQLELYVNGKWHLLQAGEEMSVEAGVPHTFRNPVDAVTKVYNTHAPAMDFEGYFTGLNQVMNKLSDQNKKPLKMNPNTLMHLAMLMKKYNKEIVSVNPPDFVISVFNRIGKLRGLKV